MVAAARIEDARTPADEARRHGRPLEVPAVARFLTVTPELAQVWLQGPHTRFFGAEVAGSIGMGISAVHSAFSSLLEQGVLENLRPSERTGRALRVVEDPLRWKPVA